MPEPTMTAEALQEENHAIRLRLREVTAELEAARKQIAQLEDKGYKAVALLIDANLATHDAEEAAQAARRYPILTDADRQVLASAEAWAVDRGSRSDLAAELRIAVRARRRRGGAT